MTQYVVSHIYQPDVTSLEIADFFNWIAHSLTYRSTINSYDALLVPVIYFD